MPAPKPCLGVGQRRCTAFALVGESRCPSCKAEFEAVRRADPTLTGRRGSTPEWRRARGLSLFRHDHRCVRCRIDAITVKARGGALHVHHKDGDATNNRQGNLEPLCWYPDRDSCHAQAERELKLGIAI